MALHAGGDVMHTIEEWLPCPSWPGYAASSHGRIRRTTSGRLTAAGRVIGSNVKNRYAMVSVKRPDGFMSVPSHWLVTDAFLGPRPDGLVTNHIDGDKHNNRPENLEYVTQRENALHSQHTGLQKKHGEYCNFTVITEEQVRGVHARFASGSSLLEVSKTFGISKTHVLDIAHGKAWRHLGLEPIRRRRLTDVVMDEVAQRGVIHINDLPSIVDSEPRLRHYCKATTNSRASGYRALRLLVKSGQVRFLGSGCYGAAL